MEIIDGKLEQIMLWELQLKNDHHTHYGLDVFAIKNKL
jgi:hypothetical protein